MKYIILFFISSLVFAQPETHLIKNGSAKYKVSYLTKTVHAESKEVKGKMICVNYCEFLLAIALKTFDSGDSNRDLNMQSILDAGTFPVVSAKGKFKKELWGKSEFTIDALVSFHGVEIKYPVTVSEHGRRALLTLDLDKHKIERPSLFAVKIDNEVPVEFKLDWSE